MIKPLGLNVVIKPTEEHISDVIHVAEANRAPSCYGVVMAVGPKVSADDLRVGDRVFVGRYEGRKVRDGDDLEDLRIVPLEAVLGRFTAETV